MNVIIFPQLESQQEIPSVDLSNVLSVSSSSSSDRNISFPLSYLFEIGDLPIDPVSSSCVQSRSSFHPPHPSISTITCTKWSSVRLPISCIRQQHSRWVYTLMLMVIFVVCTDPANVRILVSNQSRVFRVFLVQSSRLWSCFATCKPVISVKQILHFSANYKFLCHQSCCPGRQHESKRRWRHLYARYGNSVQNMPNLSNLIQGQERPEIL